MRIGIISDLDFTYVGQYHYQVNLILALAEKLPDSNLLVFGDVKKLKEQIPERSNLTFIPYNRNSRKVFNSILLGKLNFGNADSELEKIKTQKPDLLIQPTITTTEGFYTGIPFIACIHDMMHRKYKNLREYRLRARLLKNFIEKRNARKSSAIVAESETGKLDIIKYYGIPCEKIKIIPYIPPHYIFKYKNLSQEECAELLKPYNLPAKFLFYPARFIEHKNHINLLKAIAYLKETKNISVNLVLCGPPDDSYQTVTAFISENGLSEQVKILGYVGEKEIAALYRRSAALMYASIYGPTNLPPLEALVMKTPVICPDLFEMPSQAGPAGITFNPFDHLSIAKSIYSVWTNETLRNKLAEAAGKKSAELDFNVFAESWKKIALG